MENIRGLPRFDEKNAAEPKLWMLCPALMQNRTPIEITCFASESCLTTSEIVWSNVFIKPCNVFCLSRLAVI